MDSELEPGNSWQIVSSVYLAVLLPWGFLYLHDFISERWTTIRRTKVAGIIHLIAAFLPTPYIVVYVVFQVNLTEPDFKEMCAAVTAVVFSIYHVLRTLMGLLQLAKFRAWAIETAHVMEMASYQCQLSEGAGRPLKEYRKRRPWHVRLREWVRRLRWATKRRVTGSRRNGDGSQNGNKGIYMSALSSNISLQQVWRRNSEKRSKQRDLEHGLGDGIEDEAMESPTHGRSNPEKLREERMNRIEWYVDHMTINSTIIDNEIMNSNSPLMFNWQKRALQPRHRKSMFIRWSVVYLAQFGREFLKKCKTTTREEGPWSNRRWNFAASVWATAALRMQSNCYSKREDRLTETGNMGGKSFVELTDWEMLTALHHDQVLSKEDALKKAYRRGKRLPHGAPLIDEGQDIPSRGVYRSLIKDAINALPTRYYEEVEHLSHSQLEWFALLLAVGRWGGCSTTTEAEETAEGLSTAELKEGRDEYRENVPIDSKDTPVMVLQQQLGLPFPPSIHDCGFPVPGHTYGGWLWDNRCVLQVSGRIDNWICLRTGQTLAFLLDHEEKFRRQGTLFRDAHYPLIASSSESGGDKAVSNLDETRSHQIRVFHHDLEIARLRYQLAEEKPRHNYLEHSLTFMGCVMESVRSKLAESVDRPMQVENWTPDIPDDEVSFPMSTQLKDCLRTIFFEETIDSEGTTLLCPDELRKHGYNSAIEERLLWECQNGLHWRLERKLAYARRHGYPASTVESVEAMMLCLLGFPAMRIVPERLHHRTRKTLPSLKFDISPVLAPQALYLGVAADCGSSTLQLEFLRGDDPGANTSSGLVWKWQDWRDAFQGRMVGQAEWQRNHYMREVRIQRTTAPISSGIEKMAVFTLNNGSAADLQHIDESHKTKIWQGWRPFRAGMTIFELKNSELIVVGDALPSDSYDHSGPFPRGMDGTLHRTSWKSRDRYSRVHPAAITDASFHLDSLLALNDDLLGEANEHGKRHGTSTLADTSAEEDLSSDDMQKFRAELRSSGEAVPGTPQKMAELIMERAQKQDPVAMQRLAKMVWRGEKPYKKDRDRALQLMERALVLGRRIETAQLLVKALLEAPTGSEADTNRALRNLELLWRDISGRRKVVRTSAGRKIHQWRGRGKKETERVSQLRDLHLKVIETRPRADMIRDLADRLSTWSSEEVDNDLAIRLYETAIIARQDAKALLELGRKFDSTETDTRPSDDLFALMLYHRVLNTKSPTSHSQTHIKAETCLLKLCAHLRTTRPALQARVVRQALTWAAQGGDRESMKELSLMLLHGADGVERDVGMGQRMARRAVYGEEVSRQLASGVEYLDVDRVTAERLAGDAARVFGRREGAGGVSVGGGAT